MAKKTVQQVRRRDRANANPSSGEATASNVMKKYKYDYSKDYADPNWPYNRGKMDFGAKLTLFLFPIIVVTGISYVYYKSQLKEMVRRPLDVPKIISPTAVSAAEDPERFWGTYRSNVYFGMKTRSPKSPVFGLMWMSQFTGEQPRIRHWCDQGDGLLMYSWFAHDAVNFGVQELADRWFSVSTDFVKRPGGDHGGDWSAVVKVSPRAGAEQAVVSLFYYVALDGQGSLSPNVKNSRLASVAGSSEELGNFTLKFGRSTAAKTKFNYLVTSHYGLDRLKERMMEGMAMYPWDKEKNLKYIGLSGNFVAKGAQADYAIFQVTTTLPYEFEVQFESASFVQRQDELKGEVLQRELQKHLTAFDEKFENLFGLEKKAFSKEEVGFAKAALSNMLGSIGYFYGHSLVESQYSDPKEPPRAYWDAPLYTAVPSRSFFPRGFLWDEGFHNLLIHKWNPTVSKDIIGHWLDLMNAEGWIPREQILGAEARARVPPEFVVQHNENANPPTLLLPLQAIVTQLSRSTDTKDREYLEHLFPRLRAWYNWFNTTQLGATPSAYRWRGRDFAATRELNPKTLTSGLDDYPRASHPSEAERHVDLRCWMALMSRLMADIARSVQQPHQDYESTYLLLTDPRLLDTLHWSQEKQRYADWGLHTDHVRLERPKPPKTPPPGQRPQPTPQDKVRVVKKEPTYGFVDSYFGYVSLFPFLIKVVEPDSLKLGKILQDMQDASLMWSKFGLRSLGKNSPLYHQHNTEHDPPYWRGAVWLNVNYLALGALRHYAGVEGPHSATAGEIYKELRENLISNMVAQYKATGYIWESYDDTTGKGKGTHPFTGWSALIVAIMAEEY